VSTFPGHFDFRANAPGAPGTSGAFFFCRDLAVARHYEHGVGMVMIDNIKLKTALHELNCSALAFSSLAAPPLVTRKVSQQTVSQWVSGTKEFDSGEAGEFLQVTEAMKHLQEIVVPKIPVDWSNVLGVKDALVQTFEKRKNELDPIHNRCWFVRLSVHNFFKGLRSDGSVIETMAYYDDEAVAFTNYELASEVAEKLKQRNIPTKVEMLTCQRRQSTITVALEELGL